MVVKQENDLTNIEDVLARLDKDTLSKFRMGSEIEKRHLPTASFGINEITGGGFPVGHQTTLWGNQSAGKSALMLATIALNQKRGVPCAYVDAEKTFDDEWAQKLGVDTNALPVTKPSTIGDVADAVIKLVNAGFELVVIDSMAQLMPKSFFNEGEIKPFEKTGQIGQQARELGQMCRMIQGENWDTAVVFINQVRMDLGNSFMASQKTTGGMEILHLDSLRIRLFSSKSEKQALTGKREYNGVMLDEIIGRTVTWNIDKNKLNGRYGTGTYDLYTQGDFIGIDRAGELLDYGIKYGIVEKGGAWITVYGERAQGRPKAIELLRNNPEIVEKLEAELVAIR
jgi:recombination protein RecA